MRIVVPMAGRGVRFKELAGLVKEYALPKPMIPVLDKPLVRWAVESYGAFLDLDGRNPDKPMQPSDLIFVCLREHEREYGIRDFLLRTFGEGIHIVFTEEVTRGPAETALLAREWIQPEEGVIISDCDHHFDAGPLWAAIHADYAAGTYAGILPIIHPGDTTPSWSYVALNERDEATVIKEKDPDMAAALCPGVIGAYYFRRGADFMAEAERMIEENDRTGGSGPGEFFMSRIYHRFMERGLRIKCARIQTGHILGTPRQLDQFYVSRGLKPNLG